MPVAALTLTCLVSTVSLIYCRFLSSLVQTGADVNGDKLSPFVAGTITMQSAATVGCLLSSDLPRCRRLHMSSTLELFVTSYCVTTIGRQSFPVAASIVCNALPVNIQSSSSISAFRQRLKTFLFQLSFRNSIIVHYRPTHYAIADFD